jgi:hypothetical protein
MTEDYIRLGLRLGRHVDGLVDSYYGSPELKQEVDAEPLREPAALVADAATLLDSTDGWLRDQVVGLETVARKLAGEEIPYADEVERCYGVRPQRVPETEFEVAHRELDRILPGDGALAARYQAWREGIRCRRSVSGRHSRPSSRSSALELSRCSASPRARRASSTTSPTSPGPRTTTTSGISGAGSP